MEIPRIYVLYGEGNSIAWLSTRNTCWEFFLIKFDKSISSFHRLEVPEADPKPISRSPKQIWKQKIHTDSDEPEFKHPSGISKPEPLPLTVGSKANNLQGGLPGSAGLPSHYTQVRHQAPQLTVPVGSVIIVVLYLKTFHQSVFCKKNCLKSGWHSHWCIKC